MAKDPESLQWALQRRVDDVLGKLGEKFGDLTGCCEVSLRPGTTFEDIGGLRAAKAQLRGFARALIEPEAYRAWGVSPPRGVLLYGPPGTGKSLLARALATAAGAAFYHLRLRSLTSKAGANSGELLRDLLGLASAEGPTAVLLDEIDALSLDHLLPPGQAREASGRLVATLCEKLDALAASPARVLMVAGTDRTDALDPALVAPGRLDHLVETGLPDPGEQREIFELHVARAAAVAGRPVVAPIDYQRLLPVVGGMSGADLAGVLRRALEARAHRPEAASAAREVAELTADVVGTDELLAAADGYKRVRGVVEKIRYGQYL